MKKVPSKSLFDLSQEYLQTEFSERAAQTIDNHTRYLGEFIRFIGRREIDPFSYRDWTTQCFKRWAPQTAKCVALAASNRFLNWMERCGHIERSPHRVTKSPLVKTQPPRAPITPQEYEMLKTASADEPSIYWAVVCGWETGMALGDVSILQWSDVSIPTRIIAIYRQKTHERCIIPLRADSECLALLEQKFADQSPDWPNRPEKGVFYVDPWLAMLYKRGHAQVQYRFNRIRNRSGIDPDKTFHNLRAAYCSRLANAGIQTALACQMTGHKNPEIFKHYVTPDVQRLHEQSNLAWAKESGVEVTA